MRNTADYNMRRPLRLRGGCGAALQHTLRRLATWQMW